MTALRRALGAVLLCSQLAPVYLLLEDPRTGLAGAATVEIGRGISPLMLWGTTVVVTVALLLARTRLTNSTRAVLGRAGESLTRPSSGLWALGLGIASFVLATLAGLVVFEHLPTLLDEMTQLLHARYFAAGQLAGDLPFPAASRLLQNDLITPLGWASVYPPLHTLLLAAGLLVGAPWLVGPLLLGVTAAFTALAADRLLGPRVTARVGSLLAATSPFLVFLGAGYLSHTSAAAFAAVAAYTALRARDGRAAWALGTGAAVGAMVASRPWSGLVIGGFFTLGLWGMAAWARRRPERADERVGSGARPGLRWILSRLSFAALGGLPFAIGLAWYNAQLFGSPFRFGYDVAFGPGHGLGLHTDPWGNAYGLREAIGYTGFDLFALGRHLLETPVPALALVGAYLLLVRRLPRGAGVLLGWATLPVLANALYWHHGYHLGPRMLYEAAPAWAVLVGLSAISLATHRTDEGIAARSSYVSGAFLWVCVLSVSAALLLELPPRTLSYRWDDASLALTRVPAIPAGSRALVFVHGSWPGRVAANLVDAGMRRDSVETLIRRNDACAAELYAQSRTSSESSRNRPGDASSPSVASAPPIDLRQLPGSPPSIELLAISPGAFVRRDPAFDWRQTCRREAVADRLGVIELAPLLWQTPLPSDEAPIVLVRDLGPAVDQEIAARMRDRDPFFLMQRAPDRAPELVPFAEGLQLLWVGD